MSSAARAPQPGPAPAGTPGVQSVERALDVLEAMARAGTPLGISDVAAATGLADGTAHRLLRTLVARGYARQGLDRRYALGPRLLGLGDGARRAVAEGAGALLARLVELSAETANLAVLEGDHVTYVAQVPSAHRLRLFAEVGRAVSAHSTAVGKVLLAGLCDEEVDALLARTGLRAHTPRTITDPARLRSELEQVRVRGYAVDDEEEETGVRCVAVPVLDGAAVLAAMSVSGPVGRVPAVPSAELVAGMQAVAAAFVTVDRQSPTG